MNIRFHPDAIAEFGDAALYYDQQQDGLGSRFVDAVEEAIKGIQEGPSRWPVLDQDIRRRMVRVFPFAILYTVEPRFIMIIAVMHSHKKPFYWRSRASN